jgi:hypothetical protein
MAWDGWRVFDWDYGDFDDRLARRPASYGAAAGGPSIRETVAWLELPTKSAVAGTLIALLFAWPPLMVARIFGALSSRAFGVIIVLVAVVSSVGCWAVTCFERRTCARQWERLPDHEDPPPWK